MAYWLDYNTPYCPTGQKSYRCDDSSDIEDLPTNLREGTPMGDSETHKMCKPGSFCLSIGDSTGYMLKSDGTWAEI